MKIRPLSTPKSEKGGELTSLEKLWKRIKLQSPKARFPQKRQDEERFSEPLELLSQQFSAF
jgi:hypothetical protein